MNDQPLTPSEYRYYYRVIGVGLVLCGLFGVVLGDLPTAGAGVVLGVGMIALSLRGKHGKG